MGAALSIRLVVGPVRAEMIATSAVSRVRSDAHMAETNWTGLIQRTATGDQHAIAEFYDATSHLVLGLALRILGDHSAAEDVVVETYAQAWRQAKHYDPTRGTACAWLLTLTRSRAIDVLRARKRDRESDPLETAADVESSTPGPEAAAADAERHHFVRHALSALNAEQREAIELAYFAGLSHTEIAARLEQPLGTIKTRIRLGMLRLREVLGHLAPHTLASELRDSHWPVRRTDGRSV